MAKEEKAVQENKERKTTLSAEEAIRYIRTYFNETVKDSHGRYNVMAALL